MNDTTTNPLNDIRQPCNSINHVPYMIHSNHYLIIALIMIIAVPQLYGLTLIEHGGHTFSLHV